MEHSCVPREGRTYATLTCLLIFSGLWISEFLVLMYGRKFYTSFTAGLSGGLVLVRVCAAFAQLFVTHSLAMLGAIVMGHSCHFRKCPDLTWQATIFKGVPTAGLLGLYFALAVAFRYGQLWPVCRETFYHFAQAYIATSWALRIAGGLLLGAAALAYATRPALQGAAPTLSHGDAAANGGIRLLDYDSVLIISTYALSSFYDITQEFGNVSENFLLSGLATFFAVAGTLGLALFVLCVHVRPPSSLRMRVLVWFAFFYAGAGFVDFQMKEDCELSMPLIGCCDYPGLPDWRGWRHNERDHLCKLDDRCAHSNPAPGGGDLYCAVPPHAPEPPEAAVRGLAEGAPAFFQQGGLASPPSPGPAADCPTLEARWQTFLAARLPVVEEIHAEEGMLSTAYKVLAAKEGT